VSGSKEKHVIPEAHAELPADVQFTAQTSKGPASPKKDVAASPRSVVEFTQSSVHVEGDAPAAATEGAYGTQVLAGALLHAHTSNGSETTQTRITLTRTDITGTHADDRFDQGLIEVVHGGGR
jgi:hypothetical protein